MSEQRKLLEARLLIAQSEAKKKKKPSKKIKHNENMPPTDAGAATSQTKQRASAAIA